MRQAFASLAMLGLFAALAGPALGAKPSELGGEVLRAMIDEFANPPAIAKLREAGPPAIEELARMRQQVAGAHEREVKEPSPDAARIESLRKQIAKLDEIMDQVGMQRHCSSSRLYWYTDFDQAIAAARAANKPILSLRMLGQLNEDFSCANSRFFRTTLYANEQISQVLRDRYVLHWQSVRPVPKVTIDFGDGRKLERTLTGNSIHYICTPVGVPVDALPGLYGPQVFLQKIAAGADFALEMASLGADERAAALKAHHQAAFERVTAEFQADWQRVSQVGPGATAPGQAESLQLDLAAQAPPAAKRNNPPRADEAGARAIPKRMVEARLVAAALPLSPEQLKDEETWLRIAALHAEEAKIDDTSRELIRSENPTAAVAGRLAITKARVEDPLVRLVRSLESSIALDTVRNEYQLHRQIHLWLQDWRPDVNTLNHRVYAELFLTPDNDPWLGLAPVDVYTALPNGGVVRQ